MCLSLFFGGIFSPPVRAGPRKPAQKVQPCVSLWRSLRGLARVSGELWHLRTGLPGGCLRRRCVALRDFAFIWKPALSQNTHFTEQPFWKTP